MGGKTAFAGGIPQPCPCQACADNRGEWGLFPKPMVQGVYYQFVADHAGVFTPAQVITLEMATRRIFEEVRVPFSVVSIVHLVNKKKLKGRTARYARSCSTTGTSGTRTGTTGCSSSTPHTTEPSRSSPARAGPTRGSVWWQTSRQRSTTFSSRSS